MRNFDIPGSLILPDNGDMEGDEHYDELVIMAGEDSVAEQGGEIRDITKRWLDAIPLQWLEAGHAQVCQDQKALAEIRVLAAQGYYRARLFMSSYRKV